MKTNFIYPIIMRDCVEHDCIYGILMVETEEDMEDTINKTIQNEILKIKEWFDENEEDWCIEDIIEQLRLKGWNCSIMQTIELEI